MYYYTAEATSGYRMLKAFYNDSLFLSPSLLWVATRSYQKHSSGISSGYV